MTRDEIIQQTKKDIISKLLTTAIASNNWEDVRLQNFKKLRHELSVTDESIILFGTMIYLPKDLQKRAVAIAPESHKCIEKTIKLFCVRKYGSQSYQN